MRRIILIASVIVLAGGVAFAATRATAPATVYTVSQVRAGLAHDPGAWLGRVVLVRGALAAGWFAYAPLGTGRGAGQAFVTTLLQRRAAVSSAPPHSAPLPSTPPPSLFSFANTTLTLSDSGAPLTTNRLPLVLGAPNSVLAWLRRLPLVGHAMPGPQIVQWGRAGVYRVVVQSAPRQSCATGACYQLEAPDATLAPPALRWAPIVMLPVTARAAMAARVMTHLLTVTATPIAKVMPHAVP